MEPQMCECFKIIPPKNESKYQDINIIKGI